MQQNTRGVRTGAGAQASGRSGQRRTEAGRREPRRPEQRKPGGPRSQAAEQARKRAQKRRKKRRARRRMFVKLGVCAVLCLVLFTAVRSVWKWTVKPKEKPDTEKLAQEGYPESLLKLLEKNPETEQFVMDYFKNKDKHEEIDVSGEVKEGKIPLFLQWDERWGYETYGEDFLALTGCGPTSLAMVRCGLSGNGDWDPWRVARMADEEGYYVNGAGSSWELMTEGASKLGLAAEEVVFDAEHIKSTLEEGKPIICVVGPGDFTDSGHFLVLTGVDGKGKIILNDPNSKIRSRETWEVDDLMAQTKNLWAYTLTGGP